MYINLLLTRVCVLKMSRTGKRAIGNTASRLFIPSNYDAGRPYSSWVEYSGDITVPHDSAALPSPLLKGLVV